MSLERVTLMPIASAAVSSSLTASNARPIREWPRRTRKMTRTASPSVNTPVNTLTRESITSRISAASLATRFDLQATAEQPRWLVEKDQDENAEGKAILPGRHEIGDAHGLDHAEDERRHHGPGDVPRPPKEHDRQPLEPQVDSHQWRDVIAQANQYSCCPSQGGGDAKSPDRDPVHVHPQ